MIGGGSGFLTQMEPWPEEEDSQKSFRTLIDDMYIPFPVPTCGIDLALGAVNWNRRGQLKKKMFFPDYLGSRLSKGARHHRRDATRKDRLVRPKQYHS